MIGRLSREKRQDVLINAVKKSKYRDQIRLELAGQGPRREALLALGSDLGENLHIDFYSKEGLMDLISPCLLYTSGWSRNSTRKTRGKHLFIISGEFRNPAKERGV